MPAGTGNAQQASRSYPPPTRPSTKPLLEVIGDAGDAFTLDGPADSAGVDDLEALASRGGTGSGRDAQHLSSHEKYEGKNELSASQGPAPPSLSPGSSARIDHPIRASQVAMNLGYGDGETGRSRIPSAEFYHYTKQQRSSERISHGPTPPPSTLLVVPVKQERSNRFGRHSGEAGPRKSQRGSTPRGSSLDGGTRKVTEMATSPKSSGSNAQSTYVKHLESELATLRADRSSLMQAILDLKQENEEHAQAAALVDDDNDGVRESLADRVNELNGALRKANASIKLMRQANHVSIILKSQMARAHALYSLMLASCTFLYLNPFSDTQA